MTASRHGRALPDGNRDIAGGVPKPLSRATMSGRGGPKRRAFFALLAPA